ncbi:putative nucleobase-ascorbate transporter 12 [Helianthus annuus]|nr:putative nucleobase-ascorbate transporter 12 [Helianthus annuus]
MDNKKFERSLDTTEFKHIMKELQGAIIIASAFQALLGYSGLMTLLLRCVSRLFITVCSS